MKPQVNSYIIGGSAYFWVSELIPSAGDLFVDITTGFYGMCIGIADGYVLKECHCEECNESHKKFPIEDCYKLVYINSQLN